MDKRAVVVQKETGNFFFTGLPKDTTITVSIMKTPEDTLKKEILQTDKNSFEIQLHDLDYRPYFFIQTDETSFILAERTLPVAGMNNFRDMGGYKTDTGQSVKWGKLYRSDHIYNATSQGCHYLKKLNIHTIIDYRSINEINKYPNPILSDEIKTYCLDPDAHTAELSAQFSSSKNDEDKNLIAKIIQQKQQHALVNRYDIVMQQYGIFVYKDKAKQAFSKMIKIAADPNSIAMVQHCRGGKDRTGFGAMLLLGILGVSKEDLIEDYMLTDANRIERNQLKMAGYKKITTDEEVLHYLYSLIETKPEFIEQSISNIEKEYGTIKEYAIKMLDIDEDIITQLKQLYLE